MRAIGRLILVALIIVTGILFWRQWSATTPLGYGTGNYQGASAQADTDKDRASRLAQIEGDPRKYAGKRITLTGRVRGATKYASNRNIYTLHDPNSKARVLVIDDKPAPQELYTRTVTGEVRTIGPPGLTPKAYIVDVKDRAHFKPPTWQQVSAFFTQNYDEISTDVKAELPR